MSGVELVERSCGGVTVLRIDGPVSDAGTMVRLAGTLLDARVGGGHVVLDLDGLDVRDLSALCALFARLGSASRGVPIPAAVSDPGVRRLLRACGAAAAGLVCFPSVDEAAEVARPTVLSA